MGTTTRSGPLSKLPSRLYESFPQQGAQQFAHVDARFTIPDVDFSNEDTVMTYESVNKEKLVTAPRGSAPSGDGLPFSPKTQFGSPKQVRETRLRPFATEGEQSKAVQFHLPGFENVTRRVNRPQLNLNVPSSVSIEELIKVSQDTVTRVEDEKREFRRSQSASPPPYTYYEELYHMESSSNVTQLPSCFISNASHGATRSISQPLDSSFLHQYLSDIREAQESKEVRIFSFSESIKPYSHHAPFYNPSFTSPSFTLILPLKWLFSPPPKIEAIFSLCCRSSPPDGQGESISSLLATGRFMSLYTPQRGSDARSSSRTFDRFT